MIKIGRFYRERLIKLVQEGAEDAQAVLFVNFKGLSASQVNFLRISLKDKNARMLVAKNRLIRKALQGQDFDPLQFLTAETAIIYPRGDIAEVAKVLFDFRKENEKFEIKGGCIKERVLNGKELEGISKLPSRGVLLGMAANCMVSPISGFVNGLNQIILKFVWAIEEIKKTKEGGKDGKDG